MKLVKLLYSLFIKYLEIKALREFLINPEIKKTHQLLNLFGRKHVTQSVARKGDVLVNHLKGGLLICDRNDLIQSCLIHHRTFSPHIIDVIQSFIRPKSYFIDIGAHCGALSIPVALNNPQSKVIAIEPQLHLAERLHKNKRINNLNNLFIESIGLYSKEGELEISLPRGNDGKVISELVGKLDVKYTGLSSNEKIPVSTMDSLMNSKESALISIIKIDVQGNELEILKGAKKTLKKHRPCLIIEIEDKLVNNPISHRLKLKKILEENNYKLFLLDSNLSNKYPMADLDLPMENDFLAIPM